MAAVRDERAAATRSHHSADEQRRRTLTSAAPAIASTALTLQMAQPGTEQSRGSCPGSMEGTAA